MSGGGSAHPETGRLAQDQLLPSHPAPRGKIGPGCGVIRQQLDHVTGGELGKSPRQLDDRLRTGHAETIQRQPWWWIHETPTLARSSATIGGSTWRKRLTSDSVVVRVTPIRMLPCVNAPSPRERVRDAHWRRCRPIRW